MLFNSARFLVFLALVLPLYYTLPHKGQNRLLIVASLVFYAASDWRFLFPLLFTSTLDYWCARRMSELAPPARRPWLVLSVAMNLGLLGFFKYFNFFAAAAGGWHLDLLLPLGISFYTFQALSYTIDVYRGQLHARTSYADFLLSVVCFPHLVAGPIQRAGSLLPQVENPRRLHWLQISQGIELIVWGYFKKMYIADNLAPAVNRVFASPHPDTFHVILAAYAFAFQILCDFSGYTDIARGLAKLMGFEFMRNFDWPYLAAGPREFWRRWHISLSTWLRDYLYRPLGGSRNGKSRTFVNILITMTLGGLWHGAGWTFLVWGLYHGALLCASHAIGAVAAWVPRPLRIIVFFQLTCYGWLIFRAESMHQLSQMTRVLLLPTGRVDWRLAAWTLVFSAVPYVTIKALQWRWRRSEVRSFCYSVLIYLMLFRGGIPQSFLYFQF